MRQSQASTRRITRQKFVWRQRNLNVGVELTRMTPARVKTVRKSAKGQDVPDRSDAQTQDCRQASGSTHQARQVSGSCWASLQQRRGYALMLSKSASARR